MFSNSSLTSLAGGIIKLPSVKDKPPIVVAEMMNGRSILLKLTPLPKMEIISVLEAILEVKKITAIKVKSGLNKLPK